MTRKDYIAIAGALAQVEAINDASGDPAGVAASTLRIVVDQVAWVLGQDNPRFDRARFEIAALPLEHGRKVEAIKRAVGTA